MTNICASSILACGMRATLLDQTGNVSPDPDNFYVTNNMTQIQFTPDVEVGSDRTLKSGCDCIIASAKFPDLLKRFNFQIDFGALEPGLVALMTGAPLIEDAGDEIGWDWPVNAACGETPPPQVAIEVWSYVWEDNAQNDVRPFWHWIWPSTSWQFGQSTLNTDFMVPVLTGFSRGNPVWGHGPYGGGVVIGDLGSVYQVTVADGPPDAVCGLQTVSPSS